MLLPPICRQFSLSTPPMCQELPFQVSQGLSLPTLPARQELSLPTTPASQELSSQLSTPPVSREVSATPPASQELSLSNLPENQEFLFPTSPMSQEFSSPTLSISAEISPTPPVGRAMPSTTLTSKLSVTTNSTKVPSCSYSISDGEGLLTSGEITQIFLKSCSRKNFAARLSNRLFPEEVRRVSNVSGGKGKKQLDPSVIAYIKKVTFAHWPLAQTEKMDKEWTECKSAIDEKNRRLNRPPAGNKKKQ